MTGVNKLYSSQGVRFSRRLRCALRTIHTGASGVGELLANTLAVRNVAVVVLDVKPIVTENCAYPLELATVTFADQFSDNITYYKCDVTKLEEVEAVAKKVIEEVCHNAPLRCASYRPRFADRPSHRTSQQCWRRPREAHLGPLT